MSYRKHELSAEPEVSQNPVHQILNTLQDCSRDDQVNILREVLFQLLNERAAYEMKSREEYLAARESRNYLENMVNEVMSTIQQKQPPQSDLPDAFKDRLSRTY